ncbi:MAG: VOC family protein [Nanoarchaeota archaeon]
MDKVVHFEIPVDEIERAEKFYSKVFGWKTTKYPKMDYTIVHTVEIDDKMMPKESGAINGGIMKRNDKVKNPVITIDVKDIDESISKVKKAGGRVVVDNFKVGDMGVSAYFQDSEGNILGLWQSLKW